MSPSWAIFDSVGVIAQCPATAERSRPGIARMSMPAPLRSPTPLQKYTDSADGAPVCVTLGQGGDQSRRFEDTAAGSFHQQTGAVGDAVNSVAGGQELGADCFAESQEF